MCAGASAAAALHAPLCCDVSASPLRARLCAPDNPLRALHQQAADERTAAARKLADATAEHDRQVSKLRADAAVQAAKLEAAKAKEEQQQVRPGLLGACMLCAVVHRPHHAHISPDGCNLLLRCVCAHRSRCSACTTHLRLQTAATSRCTWHLCCCLRVAHPLLCRWTSSPASWPRLTARAPWRRGRCVCMTRTAPAQPDGAVHARSVSGPRRMPAACNSAHADACAPPWACLHLRRSRRRRSCWRRLV